MSPGIRLQKLGTEQPCRRLGEGEIGAIGSSENPQTIRPSPLCRGPAAIDGLVVIDDPWPSGRAWRRKPQASPPGLHIEAVEQLLIS